jgi:hypothetical protein
MEKFMNRPAIYVSVVLSMTALGDSALAGGMDGTSPAVCATNETFDCGPSRQCIADSPEGINMPRLIRLDFAAKKAFSKGMTGEERVAEISGQASQEGKLLLQGVQSGFGWTMTISQESGEMVLTIAGEGAGFVIFGTCTPL